MHCPLPSRPVRGEGLREWLFCRGYEGAEPCIRPIGTGAWDVKVPNCPYIIRPPYGFFMTPQYEIC